MPCLGEDTKKWLSILKSKDIPIIEDINKHLEYTESDIDSYCNNPRTYVDNIKKIRNMIKYSVERSKQFKQFHDMLKEIKKNISNINLDGIERFTDMENAHTLMIKEFNKLPKKRKREREIPHECMCPITLDCMIDPVICSDGHTYERSAITHVLYSKKPYSPITREKLNKNIIIPNINIKKLISQM